MFFGKKMTLEDNIGKTIKETFRVAWCILRLILTKMEIMLSVVNPKTAREGGWGGGGSN